MAQQLMIMDLVRAFKEEWNGEGLRAVTSQLKEHDSLSRLKRRWLMDLPLTVSEQKRLNGMLPPDDKFLPESLIREDDLSYEGIKTRIEMGFGAHKRGKELYCAQEDTQVFNSRDVLSHLDGLTNKGLCSLIEILTDGTIKFEKTNLCMNTTIKAFLRNNDISKTKLKLVSRLLKDPENFRGNHLACLTPSEIYRVAAVSVLDKLEDFSKEALQAMHKRLTCVNGYTPSLLGHIKNRSSKKDLVHKVKKIWTEKLSELSKANNEPAEELYRALGVAGLSLKLIMNNTDVIDFCRFPPEIECLQNAIAKAIHSTKDAKRLSLTELKKVQLFLEPESNISKNHLRPMVHNLLSEYLYECSDMDKVPDYLVEAVEFINRRSQVSSCKKETSTGVLSSPHDSMKEVIRKEVEHVLTVSAQGKGVLLDLLPQHEFDEDFAHAYMEDFEDEQVWDTYENHEIDSCNYNELESYDSYGQTESTGQNKLVNTDSPSPTGKMGSDERGTSQKCEPSCDSYGQTESTGQNKLVNTDSPSPTGKMGSDERGTSQKCEPSCDSYGQTESTGQNKLVNTDSPSPTGKMGSDERGTSQKCEPSDWPLEQTNIVTEESVRSGNQYLEVQEACDATAMVAYCFVGHMLDKFAEIEGFELSEGNRLYLRGHSSSVTEDSKEPQEKLLTSEFSEIWKKLT